MVANCRVEYPNSVRRAATCRTQFEGGAGETVRRKLLHEVRCMLVCSTSHGSSRAPAPPPGGRGSRLPGADDGRRVERQIKTLGCKARPRNSN